MNATPSFRPPAVPLIALDPYTSIWSFADKLTAGSTCHWTGAWQNMTGLVRIDGACFSICGGVRVHGEPIPALPQTGLQVLPTRTIYSYKNAAVELTLTFLTPALPQDLEWMSRPVTYLVFDIVSCDGKPHEVSVYWDMGGEVAANVPSDEIVWGRLRAEGLAVVSVSAAQQRMLGRGDDNCRIEWGCAYLALPEDAGDAYVGRRAVASECFVRAGTLPGSDDFEQPCPAYGTGAGMAALLAFGKVGSLPERRHLLFAYDDRYSIEYLGQKLRPWWRRNGGGVERLLADCAAAFPHIAKKCEAYDLELQEALRCRGGEEYARLCSLAFRQCLAAHKLAAAPDGAPLYFSKECFSNGCIATVDVTYPSSPFFLALNPALLEAQLEPVLRYAASPRWKFPFAPHDLGVYPLANGQIYGGGETGEEDQMPVEECGNLLILVAALALGGRRADYVQKWWPLLSQWAGYLAQKGFDPENQLCTDDFAGHLAHNANLSLKAIIALGAYARLAGLIGEMAESARFQALARSMADSWMKAADDGDHYRLAFDAPGSWSQKYNLVWDRLLGLDLFPPEVARKEMAFYRTKLNPHGLPLDNRKSYTKLDWIFWTATLTGDPADFHALTQPSLEWVSRGASRVPLTDWYDTAGDGKQIGFQARSVVGGLFLRQLDPVS